MKQGSTLNTGNDLENVCGDPGLESQPLGWRHQGYFLCTDIDAPSPGHVVGGLCTAANLTGREERQVSIFVQNQVVFPPGKAFIYPVNTSLVPFFQPRTFVLPKKQMIICLLPYSIPSHFGGSFFVTERYY